MPCTYTTFDKVVLWLEEVLCDNIFKDQSTLPRQKTLMKCLDAKFMTPKHDLVNVALETGTKDSGVKGRNLQ
jgi:hypothetical protein